MQNGKINSMKNTLRDLNEQKLEIRRNRIGRIRMKQEKKNSLINKCAPYYRKTNESIKLKSKQLKQITKYLKQT